MQRGMARVAAVVQQDLGGFVFLPDLDDALVRGVRLAVVGAEPALAVMYYLHHVPPRLVESRAQAAKTVRVAR
jgi:hypothetical protein